MEKKESASKNKSLWGSCLLCAKLLNHQVFIYKKNIYHKYGKAKTAPTKHLHAMPNKNPNPTPHIKLNLKP